MFLHMPNQFHYTSNSVSYSIDISKKTVYQISFNNHQQLERTNTNGRISCKKHNYDKCFKDLEYLRMVEGSIDNCTTPWYEKSIMVWMHICLIFNLFYFYLFQGKWQLKYLHQGQRCQCHSLGVSRYVAFNPAILPKPLLHNASVSLWWQCRTG